MEKRRYDSSVARIAGNIASGLAQRHPLHDAQFKDWARQCVTFAREIVAETIRTEPVVAQTEFVTGMTVQDDAKVAPRDSGLASATGTEKFERMVRDARAQIAKGATHDCGEWIRDGACALCDRVMQ